MKTSRWIPSLAVGVALGCTPDPKNAGEVVDTAEGEGEGGSSSESESEGEGASFSETSISTTEDGGSTSSATTGEESTTGGGGMQACLDAGWDVSLATFTEMSAFANGTYFYTRRTGGAGLAYEECTYEVSFSAVEGVIVRRELAILTIPEDMTQADCAEQPFVETGNVVGTHAANQWVPPPYTMEELYAGCCDLLAIQPAAEYETAFAVDDIGVVQVCYAMMANCDDACGVDVDGFEGFRIDDFAIGM